ncbi:MAG: hypothetical protein J6D33_10690 [Turicibacter sp.]|nr:hypothetical protein [Turicibacter sp.]
MKIVNVNQLSQVHSLDSLVKERMIEKIEILNENYGETRMIDDLGGFVTYVNHKEQLDELLEQFPVTEAEYVDAFVGSNEENYCELLLLAGSDYNIVVFIPLILLEQYPQFNAMNE